MGEWRDYRFGDVAEILPGRYLSKEKYGSDGPYPVFGSNTLMGWSPRILYEGPLVALARIGSNFGAVMWSPSGAWINNNASAVRATREADSRFLYYWLRSFDFNAIRRGSGQPFIAHEDLAAQRISMPPLRDQAAIAELLGALDDKISSNSRLVSTTHSIVIQELLSAGAGAPSARVGDVADVRKGLSYKGSGLLVGNRSIPMVNLGNFNRSGWFERAALKAYSGEYRERHVVRGGELVVANTDLTQQRAILGRPGLLPEDLSFALFTHHVYAVRPREPSLAIALWAALNSEAFRDRAEGFATGTTVAALPLDALIDFEFPVPPVAALHAASLLFRGAWKSEVESIALANLREALAPAMLSGRLRLSPAREQVEAAV